MFICQIGGLEHSREKVLVFFKLYPTVITEKNLHHSLLVSSMLDSPINTLYQAVRQVFGPVLLKVNALYERSHRNAETQQLSYVGVFAVF